MSEVISVDFSCFVLAIFRWFANLIAAALDPARILLCVSTNCGPVWYNPSGGGCGHSSDVTSSVQLVLAW